MTSLRDLLTVGADLYVCPGGSCTPPIRGPTHRSAPTVICNRLYKPFTYNARVFQHSRQRILHP
jgi:hypothetical protein